LQEYGLDSRILIHRPSVRQWPVDAFEVLPAALEAAQHVGLRDGVTSLANARGDSFERETGRGDAQEHDFEIVANGLEMFETADVRATAQRTFKREVLISLK